MPEYSSLKSYIEEIKKQTNNYEQTVFALLAFANHARWDEEHQTIIPESQFSIGRRMDPEEGDTVTPDLVIQRTEVYGLIVEAKKTFPKEKNYWINTLKQLKRYDGKLKGWFTKDFIDTSDLVLMIHYPRSPTITDYIKERCQEGELAFRNNFSVVSFDLAEEIKTFIRLEKRFGKISEEYLDISFKNICSIAIENLISEIKFYDSEPPMPYLIQILWDNVFSAMKDEYSYDHEKKCYPIAIDVQKLTEILQKFYGPESKGEREQEIPKKSWVKKALDMLVQARPRYAEVDDKDFNKYIILYKSKRGDNLENFAKVCYLVERKERKRTRKEERQLQLPI